VSLRLLHLVFLQVLRLVLLMGRTSATKDIDLLVLRHEVAVLRRTNPHQRPDWADGPCSPRSRGGCLDRCGAIAWLLWTRSWAGIAVSSVGDGPTRTGLGGHQSTTSSPP
jgi:hypothetical protein